VSGVGRASGKVILLGEHTVVYGAAALAAGIERGARATASALAHGAPSVLRLGDATIVADAADQGGLARALAALLAAGDPLPPLEIHAESDLPPGSGLGSSAAIGVAVARAAMAIGGAEAPLDDAVIARADAWERVFHGNPSGIDTAASALGGCFRFTRREGVRVLAPARELELCVGLTGISASTRVMVEGLAHLRTREPKLVDESIEGIAALVENAVKALEVGDLEALGEQMNRNQLLLAGLRLSTEKIEELCALARGARALGAKLTGKGGGGAVVALARDNDGADAVLTAWRRAGYQGFSTRVRARTTTS
jgi:mevalonate kinase